MKKRFLFGLFFLVMSVAVWAQEETTGFDKSRLFFGGNFGLSFGNYTLVNLTPQVGYQLNQYLAVGTGINFIYSQYKTEYNTGATYSRQDQGYVGLNIFGRVYPIRQVFFQVQPEANYSWGELKYYDPDQEYKLPKEIVPTVLIGLGGAIPTGRSGAMIIMLQYDVVQNIRSPYGNAVFYSFGYSMGL